MLTGGGCVGDASVGVAWFHVYINWQLKISDETNGSKDGKRDILLFALQQNYCKGRNGGHIVCN